MNGMKLVSKIEELLDEERIDSEAAMRLMLLAQLELMERMENVEKVSNGNCDYHIKYPSITWLWSHRRKTTIAVVVAVFLLLYFMLTPIGISDLRHSIMNALEIPHELSP